MRDGVFEVLATRGDTRLGGDDLDMALARWCAERVGVGPGDLRMLKEAERVKRVLSEEQGAVFRVPFLEEGKSVEIEVGRGDFERIAAPYLERTIGCCRQAMHDAELSPEDLDAVVLKCLAKAAADRYQDVLELRDALLGCNIAGQWSREDAQAWWVSNEETASVSAEMESGELREAAAQHA